MTTPLNFRNPQSTLENYTVSKSSDAHNAIKDYGGIPLRPDGSPYVVTPFAGGYLLDGAPMNVLIEGVWYDGQKELLQPEWASGRIPTPSAAVLAVGAQPMPPEVAANYQTWLNAQGTILGMSPLTLLGVGFLAYKLIKR